MAHSPETDEHHILSRLMSKHVLRAAAALVLSSAAAYAAPQDVVTFYGLSVASPSATTTSPPCTSIACQIPPNLGPEDIPDIVHDGVHFGGQIVDASAVAVDGAGATYYVGVNKYSIIRSEGSQGRITTVTLPTPTSETITFLADATRLNLEVKGATETAGAQIKAEAGVDCTHNVDGDTPVEEGMILCEKKIGLEAAGGGENIGTTVTVTTTGKPVALGTVTNPAGLTLPTRNPGSAESMRVGWSGIVASAAIISVVQCLI